MINSEELLLMHFSNEGDVTLKDLFDRYFQELYGYTAKIVGNSESAEEIVQDLFVTIWQKRETLTISTSLKAYLFTAAKNRSINHLKKKYVVLEGLSENDVYKVYNSDMADGEVLKNELEKLIIKGLEKLPEKARMVFSLSRHSGMSHNEIAEQLGISQKTVEYHIANVLKSLRLFLENHGYCIIIIPLV